MPVPLGDGKPRQKRTVINRRRHLTHSSADALDEFAVFDDFRRGKTALLRPFADNCVERKLLAVRDFR